MSVTSPPPTLHQKRYFMVKIRKLFSPVRQGLMGENAGYIEEEEKNTIVHKIEINIKIV